MNKFLCVARHAGGALLALALGGCALQANSHTSPPSRVSLVQVDVHDRAGGSNLPVHTKDGRQYIVGTPGHEYTVRIRNLTGARVLVVTGVDGVNVISGDTAAPSQSGYVLEPWGSVQILGWRKSLERTAAFFFTEHQNSYAARTGRPQNVGVIGVAVFREKPKPIAYRDDRRRSASASEREAPAGADRPEASAAPPAPYQEGAELRAQESARPLGKLGTGHGRSEASRVTLVNFERESETPAQTVVLQYDRRENLIAMGVLPAPGSPLVRRDPQPFPGGMRFAPDPDR